MADGLEDLKRHVGESATEHDVATASQAGRLAATLDVAHPAPNPGDPLPPGWHGIFFPPLSPQSRLRPDGQPAGGGLMPPVPLPRRRLEAVRATFHAPIRIGEALTKVSEVAEVTVADHGAGPTVAIRIRESITGPAGLAVVEERAFLFFGESGPGIAAAPPDLPAEAAWRRTFEPSPAMLFRASAVRFNSHRVHYDRDYTTKVEGMPGLVVPATLVSAQMIELCRAHAGSRALAAFEHRSVGRIFDLGPYTVHGAPEGDGARLWATDHAGRPAILAEARFAG